MVTLFLVEPSLQRRDAPLHWAQRAGGIMLLVVAGLTLLLGVYPQPVLAVVQNVGF
ncbi:NADH-quinone oxidoreductase subunit N [compost metagenome]